MIINCIQCNTELTGKYSNRSKFCSIKCSSKFFNNNYENTCLNCSSTFKGRKEKKYCSSECLKNYNLKNPKPISSKSYRKGSSKIGMDTFRHPVFNWVRNIYDKKECGSCKTFKTYLEFRKLKNTSSAFKEGRGFCGRDKNLYFSKCKKCENSEFMLRYRKNPYHQLFHNFKKRASSAKVPFELTKDEMRIIFEKSDDKCPVFGFKFVKNATRDNRDYAPSLDRIDPKKGYTKENTIVVSMLANRIKTDAKIKDIGKVFNFYKKLIKTKKIY